MKRYSTAEKRRLTLLIGAVLILTSLPYLVGFAVQGESWRYSGMLFGIEDGNSYIAKMRLGTSGDWLFRTPYTAVQQQGMFAFLPFFLLGKLAAGADTHIQLVALFHLFRLLAAAAMVAASYAFAARFVRSESLRLWTTILATLGGGLGFLFITPLAGWWNHPIPGLNQPLEFYSPETFGFLSMLGLPHLALARALLLWGLLRYLAPAAEGEKSALGGGLLWLAMGFCQPITVVVGYALLAAHAGTVALITFFNHPADFWDVRHAAHWLYARRALWMGLISGIVPLYTFVAFSVDPFLRAWQGQNLILSPWVWQYLLAYALLLPLALWGAWYMARSNDRTAWIAPVWLVIAPILAYAPVGVQRRLPEGIWVMICVAAAVAIEAMRPRPAQVVQRVLLPLSLLSTLFLWAGGLLTTSQPAVPLFLPTDETTAFLYIADHAAKGEVVLANYEASNALPAYARVRVIIGHGPESVDLAAVQGKVDCFYRADCADESRRALLAEFDVRYVLFTPPDALESASPPAFDPAAAPYLTLLYDVAGYSVWGVSTP